MCVGGYGPLSLCFSGSVFKGERRENDQRNQPYLETEFTALWDSGLQLKIVYFICYSVENVV